VVDTLLASRLVEATREVPPSKATVVEVTNNPNPDTATVLEETNTEAARTANRKITLTVTSKAATVGATIARTETHRAAMGDRTTLLEATVEVMVDLTADRMEPHRPAMDDRMTPMGATEALVAYLMTVPMKTSRVVTDDQTTRTEATGTVKEDPTTDRTKTPRADMEGQTIPMEAAEAVMVNRTIIAIVDRKIPTQAAPLVVVDRRTTLTEALREAMIDLTTTTTLVPMADRKNAPVDMAALEGVMVPAETRMTPPPIVQDTNPRTSRRRTPIPLATRIPPTTPTPPATRILPEEVMVEIVRPKARTTPLAATEAEVIVVKAMVEDITTKSIMMMTKPMVPRD